MDEKKFELTPIGQTVWEDRYALKDESGNQVEKDISETFHRVAKAIASKEKDPKKWEKKFFDLMINKYFCPAGRILAHSGTHYSQLLNCFVLPFKDDSLESIMDTAKNMAIVQKFGGGCGFSYSTLRPSGAYIKGVNGRSCGVLGFIDMMNVISGVIEQGGCLTRDSLINTGGGLLYLKEIVKDNRAGWHSHDLLVKTKDGDNNSKRYFLNGFSNIIKIDTNIGTYLKGTPNHKVYVFDETGFHWKELRDIAKGDFLVHKLNQYEGTPQYLDANITVDIHHNCTIPDKIPKEIDKKFAFFLGYMLGNGFSTTKEDNYRIGVSIPDKSYLNDEITGICNSLFGNNISVLSMKKPNDASTTYYISNKIIKSFLSNNGLLKGKSVDAEIPLKVRCSSREILCSYLAGLFEADGAVTHGYPQLNTTSYKLATELHVLLLSLGIPSKIGKIKKGLSSFSQTPVYSIKVFSFKGLEVWNSYVKCDKRSRFSKCLTFQPDLSRESSYILPHSNFWLGEILVRLYNRNEKSPEIKKLIKQIQRYTRKDRNFTLSAYKMIDKKLSFFNESLPDVGDLLFSEVISKTEDTEDTFDLEVDNSHSYIANSLITHNSRRGANLGLLQIDHPDVWEYISYKNDHNWERLREFIDVRDEEKWAYFKYENPYKLQMYNISIAISDEFLEALEKDATWPFVWKDTEWELYTVQYRKHLKDNTYVDKKFEVTADSNKTAIWKVKRRVPYPKGTDIFEVISKRKIKASEIWDRLAYNAWADGCPGLINISTTRRMHNMEYAHPIEATNPCGEQPLPGNSSCNLGSLVLSSFLHLVGEEIKFDFELFKNTIHTAIRFLDNVLDNCDYPIADIKKMSAKDRRVGLGTMGIHDLLIAVKLSYDSEEGRVMVEKLLKILRDESYKASIELAKEKGSFSSFLKDKFLESGFVKTLPEDIQKAIAEHGMRNATVNSQAPSGTTGTMYSVSTGCEPWFDLTFTRNTRLGSYEDGCPAYIKWKKENLEKPLPLYFKTAQNILPEDHLKMLILFSKYIDSAVSKTVNLASSATVGDIKSIFLTAMKNGVKGITVFREGSKEGVFKRHDKKEDVKEKAREALEEIKPPEERVVKENIIMDGRLSPKARGNRTIGSTTRVHMTGRNLYVTVNKNVDGEIIEVFATVGEKKGGASRETSGVEDSWAEALGKMISLAARAGVNVESVIRNLKNIPSDKPAFTTIGDCASSEVIPSPPHAIARIIEEELKYKYVDQIKSEDLNNKEGVCEKCGSANIKWRTPTCYYCIDCAYQGCG